MNLKQALDFVRYHGVVLEAAKGAEPSLVEHLTGEKIKGSWWSHPRGGEIYALTRKLHDSKAVLPCTLAKGRITYIHRRLWPGFIRLARRFPAKSLDRVREVHTASGAHQRQDIPFPDWVPEAVLKKSKILEVKAAQREIFKWLERYSD